jgi:hypothetical protein
MIYMKKKRYAFFIIFCSVLFQIINISKKNVETIKLKFYNQSFFFCNRVDYEIMWKNTVESGRPRMKHGACALHAWYLRLQTHSESVILPLQQWLPERPSNVCYVTRTLPVFFINDLPEALSLAQTTGSQSLDVQRYFLSLLSLLLILILLLFITFMQGTYNYVPEKTCF